ncbi:MAG: hypothetical protein ABI477_20740 [Chryseolinea sp.]
MEIYYLDKLLFKKTSAQHNDSYVNYDYGINAVVGWNVTLTPKLAITVEARCARGLKRINKTNISDLTNNAFGVVAGISLLR